MIALSTTIGNLSSADPDSPLSWANGCANCKHGIALAPELTGACELYLERMVQAADQDIKFCDCRAGHMRRQQMRRLFSERKKETPIRGMAGEFDDIANARWQMHTALAKRDVPTIHQQEA